MNVRLRPVTASDSTDVLDWRNAPEVRRFVFEQAPIAADTHATWFTAMLDSPTSAFFICERDNQPCGVVGLTGLETGAADWGFYTTPGAPKGSGTVMLTLMLDHAFTNMGLSRINAEVLDYNAASLHLHDKLGFIRTGLRKDHALADGTFHDVVLFAKTAPTQPQDSP